MTTIFDLYEERGELLDTKYEAAINERPFYLQSSLDDINDQIRLLENITPEAQAEYFAVPTYTESELTRKTKTANRKPWPKYGYTGADSKGTVDVSNIPAYSTHKPHRGKSYDQHESHAWTVDGE